jgi:hypothetical protein
VISEKLGEGDVVDVSIVIATFPILIEYSVASPNVGESRAYVETTEPPQTNITIQ